MNDPRLTGLVSYPLPKPTPEPTPHGPGMYDTLSAWGNQMGNQMGAWGNQMGNQMGAWGSKNKHTILKALYIFMAVIAIAGSVLSMLYNNYPTSIGITTETTKATKDGWVIGTTIAVCAGVGITTLLAAFGIDSHSQDDVA